MADTSVWIDHFRSTSAELDAQLRRGAVIMHQFVLGELACGNLAHRSETLLELKELDEAPVADAGEVLELIERNRLYGRGIGWVDAHLLASLRLEPDVHLWTRDRRLFSVGRELGLPVSGLH